MQILITYWKGVCGCDSSARGFRLAAGRPSEAELRAFRARPARLSGVRLVNYGRRRR